MKPGITLARALLVILMNLGGYSVYAQQTRPTPPRQATPDVHEAYLAAINSNNLEKYLGFN